MTQMQGRRRDWRIPGTSYRFYGLVYGGDVGMPVHHDWLELLWQQFALRGSFDLSFHVVHHAGLASIPERPACLRHSLFATLPWLDGQRWPDGQRQRAN